MSGGGGLRPLTSIMASFACGYAITLAGWLSTVQPLGKRA